MTAHSITNIRDIRNYVLGGNAIFTLVSTRTGTRFTFHMEKAKSVYWISVLDGPENESDYAFLGSVYRNNKTGWWTMKPSEKSRIPLGAPSMLGAGFFIGRINVEQDLDERLEFWHSGKCSRCGRRLTTPESIERGLGPVCAEKTNY